MARAATRRRVRPRGENGDVLLNQDTHTVQLIDRDERVRSFAMTALRDHRFVEPVTSS